MHNEVLNKFKDPSGQNRKPFCLLLDSTKVPIQKSGDQEVQKRTYYDPKKTHAVTFTNITSPNGSIVLYTKMAASISPQHWDSIVTGNLLFQDICDESDSEKLHSGLTTLFRGTSKYFAVIVCDLGFAYCPHNVDIDKVYL